MSWPYFCSPLGFLQRMAPLSFPLLDVQMLVSRFFLLPNWIALHKTPTIIQITLSTHILPVPIPSIDHSPIHCRLSSCSNSFQPTLHVLSLELGLGVYINPSPPTSYPLFFLHTTHPVKPPTPSIPPTPLKIIQLHIILLIHHSSLSI